MEKSEAANRLKKAGYQVQFDASVVTVILPAKVNRNQEIKKLHGFFEEIGYHASFGIRQTKGNSTDENIWEKSEEEKFNTVAEQTVEKKSGESLAMDMKESVDTEPQERFPEVEIGEQFSLEDFGIS